MFCSTGFKQRRLVLKFSLKKRDTQAATDTHL
jgi:hypothetical protein